MMTLERFAPLDARIALGTAFLSAVAARFGLWDDRADPFRDISSTDPVSGDNEATVSFQVSPGEDIPTVGETTLALLAALLALAGLAAVRRT